MTFYSNSIFLNYYFLNYSLILNLLIINLFFFILILSFFVISLRNTIHTVFFFMFICLIITELCILLQMEFLALTFVIIYLGAICVLILFQVKLVKLLTEKNQKIFINNTLFIPCLIIFILVPIIQCGTIYFIYSSYQLTDTILYTTLIDKSSIDFFFYNKWNLDINKKDTLTLLGLIIYYFNPIYLLIGSLILIIAMIGAIILTLEKKEIFNNV